MRVHVSLTPAEFPDAPLTGCVALAVDVLRATTASVAACDAGCRRLVPVPDAKAAEVFAARDGSDTVLAGERGGEALTTAPLVPMKPGVSSAMSTRNDQDGGCRHRRLDHSTADHRRGRPPSSPRSAWGAAPSC